ncbi:MAG: SIMPL domain-containing protein, partial [Vicinamibacterales bacterium]
MLKALTLITMCATAVPAFAQTPAAPQGPPVIVTTGEGVVRTAPDRAWVTVAAETRERNTQDAQRMNAQAMTAVIAQVKAAGVPADAVQTSSYVLQPEFDYANGKQTLRDYVARNSVQVRVDTLAKLVEILASAIGTGATNVSGVRFDLKNR